MQRECGRRRPPRADCPYTFQKRIALGWRRLIDRRPVLTMLVSVALLVGVLAAVGVALLR